MRIARRLASVLVVWILVPGVLAAQDSCPDADSTAPCVKPNGSHGSRAAQEVDLGAFGRFAYTRPGRLQAFRNVPGTLGRTMDLAFRRDRVRGWAVITTSTLGLIAADEWVLDKTRNVARHLDIPPTHPSANLVVAGVKVLPFPTTISSAMYFLGDGWMSMAVAGHFFVVGVWHNDYRALRTASEITESLFTLGIITQGLKHTFGRQTPSEATVRRGRWRPFPSLAAYARNTPAFDAFPSGHLAAAVATVWVVAGNYPENRFVRPVGYALLGILSFAMVNTGVHWASDYPLAIGIGATVADAAVARGRTRLKPGSRGEFSEARGVRIAPIMTPTRLGLSIEF